MPVEIRCASKRGRTLVSRLRADALRLLALSSLQSDELSVALVGDPAIRGLNRRYRGVDHATDVLSFSQLEEVSGPGGRRSGCPPPRSRRRRRSLATGAPRLIGDVVISLDTAERQARQMKLSVGTRLRQLLIHGFLHLLGYDHERSAADAHAMFARERELAAALASRRSR